MDVLVQVLVFGVVRGLGEAVSRRPVALAHRGFTLVVNLCRDTGESGRAYGGPEGQNATTFLSCFVKCYV